MKHVLLGSLCTPKQWKSLKKTEFTTKGFPVYGANGVIGYYSEYNHEYPTLLIGCRGSCGTVNICAEKSYVTSNAMCLDNLSDAIDIHFLYHYLKSYDFTHVISGTSQPQITKSSIASIAVPLPLSEDQQFFRTVFDGIDTLIEIRRDEAYALDDLVKSRFVEMFGDPENPSSECEVCKLGDRCDVVTGNTPARARKEYYGPGIDWIKSDNVLPGAMHLEKAKEQLTDAGKAVARIAEPGWLLMVCIAGSPNTIGNTAYVDREVAFNQQINGINPRNENPIYLQSVLGLLKPRLTSGLNAALKCILNKSTLSATEVPFPSSGLQDEFAAFVRQVDKSRFAVQQAIEQLELLKASLMQDYFG